MTSVVSCNFILLFILQCVASQGIEHMVSTKATIELQRGTSGLIQCRVGRKAYAVYWKRGKSVTSLGDALVILDMYFNFGQRSGDGYDGGLYNVTDDFSLVIKNVTLQNEGRYFCVVSDYLTGIIFRNSTNVSVYVPIDERYPIIQECSLPDAVLGNERNCSLKPMPMDASINITCMVLSYHDSSATVEIYHQGEQVVEAYRINTDSVNSDGTTDTFVTVTVTPSYSPYKCVVTGRRIDRSRSAHILVPLMIEGTRDLNSTKTDDETFPDMPQELSSDSVMNRGKEILIRSDVGVIVGSVIGAIAALGILIGIALCYCCCFAAAAVPERRREEEEEWDKEMLSYSLAANPLTNPGMGQASVAHNLGASRYAIGEHGVVFED